MGGTLEILLNHDIPNALGASPDPQYYPPNLGDTWNIITAVSSLADFDGSGTVDSGDRVQWEGDYGVNGNSDANGDGDSDGADFLAWQRAFGQTAGAISGTFDIFVVDDFFGDLAAHGLDMQVNYIGSSAVQIEVVSAGAIKAVPEPAAAILLVFSIFLSRQIGGQRLGAEKRPKNRPVRKKQVLGKTSVSASRSTGNYSRMGRK